MTATSICPVPHDRAVEIVAEVMAEQRPATRDDLVHLVRIRLGGWTPGDATIAEAAILAVRLVIAEVPPTVRTAYDQAAVFARAAERWMRATVMRDGVETFAARLVTLHALRELAAVIRRDDVRDLMDSRAAAPAAAASAPPGSPGSPPPFDPAAAAALR